MYNYETEKPFVFTEEGSRAFLKIRDRTFELLEKSGAARCDKMLIGTGSVWSLLACVDRMVEVGDIREITQLCQVAGQDRIFIRA